MKLGFSIFNCPDNVLIEVDNSEKYTVDKALSVELEKGVHHIRINQQSVYYTKKWLKLLANPFRFLGYAFFKSETNWSTKPGSDTATISFDVSVENSDFEIILEWCKINEKDNFLEQKAVFNIKSMKNAVSNIDDKHSKTYLKRWRIVRTIPVLIMDFLLWFGACYTYDFSPVSLFVPAIYTIFACVYFYFLKRQKK